MDRQVDQPGAFPPRERRVSFFSGPGLKIAAIVTLPPDYREGQKRPGIVLAGGPAGLKETMLPEVARNFAEGGYAVLRFDYRGFGESEGTPLRLIPLEEADDALCGLSFLEQQPEVDPARLGLWGTGTGGGIVSWAAAMDARVKAVVCANGQSDLGRWIRGLGPPDRLPELMRLLDEDRKHRALTGKSRPVETHVIFTTTPEVEERLRKLRSAVPGLAARRRELTLESAEAMLNFRPEDVVHRIAPRAVAWICASQNPNDILEAQKGFDKAGEPKSLVIIPGFKHHELYSPEGLQKLLAPSRAWFDAHL